MPESKEGTPRGFVPSVVHPDTHFPIPHPAPPPVHPVPPPDVMNPVLHIDPQDDNRTVTRKEFNSFIGHVLDSLTLIETDLEDIVERLNKFNVASSHKI